MDTADHRRELPPLEDAAMDPAPFAIPVVDISGFIDADPDDDCERLAVVDAVTAAQRHLGLMYVTGHGISSLTIERCREAARTFFRQDVATKQLSARRTPHSAGYGIRGSGAYLPRASHADSPTKEILDFGPPVSGDPADQSDPYSNKPEGFRDAVSAMYVEFERLETLLLTILSLALARASGVAVGPQFLCQAQGRHRGLLRLNYFPRQETAPAPGAMRDGAHVDWSSLTILNVEREGLEAWDGARWLPVPPLADALVVMSGELLHRWSNGKFTACRHRVTVRGARHHSRVSIVYFGMEHFVEHDDSVVTPVHAADETPRFAPLTISTYLARRFAETFPSEHGAVAPP